MVNGSISALLCVYTHWRIRLNIQLLSSFIQSRNDTDSLGSIMHQKTFDGPANWDHLDGPMAEITGYYVSRQCCRCFDACMQSACRRLVHLLNSAHVIEATIPDVDARITAGTLHRERLAGAGLTVCQDADVVAVDARRHQRLRVFIHLPRTDKLAFHDPTRTPTPTSSRGSSQECRRVVQLATGITSIAHVERVGEDPREDVHVGVVEFQL